MTGGPKNPGRSLHSRKHMMYDGKSCFVSSANARQLSGISWSRS